jgi:hypothetical protein
MERVLFDLDSEALLARSMLLPMLMKEDLKTTTDEACDDGKHANGEVVDGVTFFLRYGFGVLVVSSYVSLDPGINID